MKKIIRGIFLILAACMLCGITRQTIQAANKQKGKAVLKNGVLTISGKGAAPAGPEKKNKNKIKKIVIKKGITSIPDYAFFQYKNVKKVELPSTVKKIGCESFSGTAVQSVTVPSGVKTIGQSAFRSRKKMKKLTLPGNFTLKTEEGDDADYTIAGQVDTVVFNTRLKLNTVTMFYANHLVVHKKDPHYKSINGVIYSRDGKSLVRVPFGREELRIEDGCEEFCLQSVLYCSMDWEGDPVYESSIKKIVIPASVKRLDGEKYPAQYTTSLTKCLVSIQAKTLDGDSLSLLLHELGMKPEEILHQLPGAMDDTGEMYISKDHVLLAYSGKESEIQVPAGVKKIGAYAFCNIENLRKVVLPEGLTEIGTSALAMHGGDDENFVPLEVNLPSTLTKIGDYALFRRHIKTLALPSSVKSYGEACFGENDFTAVTLPGNLKTVPVGMFIRCEKLTRITIPDSVTTIGREAFLGCTKLRTVELGKGIRQIRKDAFMDTGAKKVILHGSGKGIVNGAFECSGMEMTYTKSVRESKTMFSIMGITRLSGKKQKVELHWNKVTGADGYQIVLAKDAKMKKGKKTLDMGKKKVKCNVLLPIKAKDIEPVYAKIRPYKKVKGKKVYGRWTKNVMEFE